MEILPLTSYNKRISRTICDYLCISFNLNFLLTDDKNEIILIDIGMQWILNRLELDCDVVVLGSQKALLSLVEPRTLLRSHWSRTQLEDRQVQMSALVLQDLKIFSNIIEYFQI